MSEVSCKIINFLINALLISCLERRKWKKRSMDPSTLLPSWVIYLHNIEPIFVLQLYRRDPQPIFWWVTFLNHFTHRLWKKSLKKLCTKRHRASQTKIVFKGVNEGKMKLYYEWWNSGGHFRADVTKL